MISSFWRLFNTKRTQRMIHEFVEPIPGLHPAGQPSAVQNRSQRFYRGTSSGLRSFWCLVLLLLASNSSATDYVTFVDNQTEADAACMAQDHRDIPCSPSGGAIVRCITQNSYSYYAPGLVQSYVYEIIEYYNPYMNQCYTSFTNNYRFVFPQPSCPPRTWFVGPNTSDCKSISEQKNFGASSQCAVGNPCQPATGNKYQAEQDYGTNESNISAVRYYNSLLNKDLGFGFGWTTFFYKRLDVATSGLTIRRADGRGEPFTCPSSTGACNGDTDTTLALAKDTAGYTLTLRDKSTERYDLAGKLLSDTSPSGQITTYAYDTNGRLATVTAPFGHTLAFGYDASNHISTVTDPTGQVIGYTCDTNNNLTRVNYPDGTAKIYHYEDANNPHGLTGISYVDSAGVTTRYATYAYDTTGKAILTQHAQTDNGAPQEKFTLAYDVPAVNQTTVTDPVNMQEVMTFSTNLGVKNLVSKVNQSDLKSMAQVFDANNNLTCKKDEENRVTLYSYNATNQKLSLTEGLTGDCSNPPASTVSTSATRTIAYQYLSTTLDLPTVISSSSVATGKIKTTTIQYTDTAHPNLPTVITQSGFTPSATPVSRTVTLGYNASGQVNIITGPRTDLLQQTLLAYNACTTGGACGQLSQVTNALGQITTYDLYDANGRLLQTTDPSGLKTNYSYDPRGRVKTITQTPPLGTPATTQYRYTPWGDVSQVIDPDGVVLNYLYDAAHYLRTITDGAGNQIRYAYDLKGNRTVDNTYDPTGALTRSLGYAYDLRNHLSQINLAGNITQLVNDAVGNLKQETDPNLHTSTHGYDALNRLIQTVDALNGVRGYGFDVNGRPTAVTAPNNLTTTYSHDDLGNRLQEISPDRGTTLYTYDAAGNVLTVTDANNIITTYTYDALNRVVLNQNSDASTPNYTYAYDTCGTGRLCAIQQNNTAHLSFGYDVWGRLNNVLDASVGLTSRYAYTPGGRLTQITYPDTGVVNYTYDTLGRVSQVSTTQGGVTTVLANNLQYHPFPPLSE